jgi:hypothetical protein
MPVSEKLVVTLKTENFLNAKSADKQESGAIGEVEY